MKQLYVWFGVILISAITSCTPEFKAELDERLEEARTTYYISPSGNDTNGGNSPEDAWKSIEKLNSFDFVPGSKILFEGGQSFPGTVTFDKNDANDGVNPILISSYGEGKATIYAGNGFGFNIYNTAGIKIDNLIIEGSGMKINQQAGIQFYNDLPNDTKLDYIRITNTEVKGFKNHGIVIGAYNGNSGFNDILIENTKVYDILDKGIASYGKFDYQKTGYAHSNFIVRNVEVYNVPGYSKGSHSGNGIELSDVQHSTIEYSTVYNCGQGNATCGGPVGIWYWDADQVTIQYNEAYNISSGSGCDGGGFDFDGGVTNGVMQYNYSHDNDGGGFLIGQFTWARPMDNIIVRYNISENDAGTNGGSVYLFNGESVTSMKNIYVYNNTFYINKRKSNKEPAAIKFNKWKAISGNINFFNNILYANDGADYLNVPSGYSANFKGNLYHSKAAATMKFQGVTYNSLEEFRATGNETHNNSPIGLQHDPKLLEPGAGKVIGFGNDLKSLTGYKIVSDSPAKDKGIQVSGNGDSDYFGNLPVSGNSQDIGAHEL